MSTRTRLTGLTYDDYAALPDDGRHYELLAGELYVNPAPSPVHQRVSKRLQRQLEAYFEGNGLGEVFDAPIDVILSNQDVAEPDILVVRHPSQISQRAIEGPPLLAVEIISPTSGRYDRVIKAARYLALGVTHYWLVDPEARHILCQRADGDRWTIVAEGRDDHSVCDPSWPELTIELAELWREPLRRED